MKRAFTLIELLVVIAIIAILAAMLMPALAEARRTAMKAACQGNEKDVGTGVRLYRNDQNDIFPIGGKRCCRCVNEILKRMVPCSIARSRCGCEKTILIPVFRIR